MPSAFRQTTPAARLFLLLVIGVVVACPSPPGARAGTPSELRERLINSYSLLHQILDQEKDVGKLLVLSKERPGVDPLIKRIAAASAAAMKDLEQFSRREPAVPLHQYALPPGEVAARDAISSTLKKELLVGTGESFELNLLLSQAQALDYAWHLAAVASANDRQRERARCLAGISDQMRNLHQEIVALLRSRMTPAKPA